LTQILALSITFLAMWMDLMTEKIANEAIVGAMIIGLMYQTSIYGVAGIWQYLQGAGIALLLLFGLFIFRMLGPGDIKLFSVLGGIIGVRAIIKCIIISFLFGAILSIAIIVTCGNLRQRLRYFIEYITRFIQTKEITAYYRPGMQIENIHFSVPIFMSIILYVGGVY